MKFNTTTTAHGAGIAASGTIKEVISHLNEINQKYSGATVKEVINAINAEQRGITLAEFERVCTAHDLTDGTAARFVGSLFRYYTNKN